jgi:Concanavalin A-like lectin/glucanases superfamily
MNTTNGTEPDNGSGGNPLTYDGGGARGGIALINDSDAASYSPLGTSTSYVTHASPMTGWPIATVTTWEVWLQLKSSDCSSAQSGQLVVVDSDWSVRYAGQFAVGIVSDAISCHVAVFGDDGNVSAVAGAGTMTAGHTYMVDFTYDETDGLEVYQNGSSTPIATSTSKYYKAWTTAEAGPICVGRKCSRTTINQPGGSAFNGLISDISLYKSKLSTARIAAHYAAGIGTLPTPSLPPEGMYTSCEVDTALSTCESQDADMKSDGYTEEVNYIGIDAHKTGANSLAAWFAYDAGIGIKQYINVKAALADANPLTGTSLLASPFTSSLAKDCGATTNQQIISCIASVGSGSAGFGGWYIYDEPGCPNQTIGYCRGSQAGHNFQNVGTLAAYIASIDSHAILGIQTPSGAPCSGGGFNCPSAVPGIANLFSCNGNTPCSGSYAWLTSSITPNTGADYYPFDAPSGTESVGQTPEDVRYIVTDMQEVFTANYAAEKMGFVGQAFSWFQEGGAGCSTYSACVYPTTAQMQNERDQALYYANASGNPIAHFFWYYWPDVICENNYTGCSATTNRASVRTAAFAPFPATPPP